MVRRATSFTIDTELINTLLENYHKELNNKLIKENKIRNIRDFSFSRFVENIIRKGMILNISDDMLKFLEESYRKAKSKNKRINFSSFVEKIIKKGLEVEKYFPG